MMVTFVSQCEKKASAKTRRVLDSFADRIGANVWQTVVTEEGLIAIRKLLRKTASKNTAVSCHWIRSRSRSDLVWVVGNKRKFDGLGRVPVNSTASNQSFRDDAADWHYLPLIQALASMAALFHDWGKANARFQLKLHPDYKGNRSDPLRHEWVSCLLMRVVIDQSDGDGDRGWLTVLKDGGLNADHFTTDFLNEIEKPLSGLPPIAQLVMWLVATHHKLPIHKKKKEGDHVGSLKSILSLIDRNWGYSSLDAGKPGDCLEFSDGFLIDSKPWIKPLQRWAKKMLALEDMVAKSIADGSYRVLLHHARLCLMLGDHFYSSLDVSVTGTWKDSTSLIANTQDNGEPKQLLDQHLVGVYEAAKRNVRLLPTIESRLQVSTDVSQLLQNSTSEYRWQERAASKIQRWTDESKEKRKGFFAVNMASTGCGKTFANAKIMLALSTDSTLRFTLALGLRTLTLQTGDEYRERIFTNGGGDDLAVVIGSRAIEELHEQTKFQSVEAKSEGGSESQESLLAGVDEVRYEPIDDEGQLATVLTSERDRNFLYAPVLVCTIDHIIAATETIRGGRYILPSLRVMSSDLVIDEIDDFTGSDLIAIGRLIYFAGMMGRKVMISSATIPPALAKGYFHAYQKGWSAFTKTRNAGDEIACVWIDEFNTRLTELSCNSRADEVYAIGHEAFVTKRTQELAGQPARRKGEIVKCHLDSADNLTKKGRYYETIRDAAIQKHLQHSEDDPHSRLRVSFGVIRTANIVPCVDLTRYLLQCGLPDDVEIRVIPYHSQQVLLLRHEQEKLLDQLLKRKSGASPLTHHLVREHLEFVQGNDPSKIHLIFIVVATPVEEVGRDHDFDWAIVEPSSYRSIIQIAGRVRRHRPEAVELPNVGILQYNLRTIEKGEEVKKPRFYQPGYEQCSVLRNGMPGSFKSHNLEEIVDRRLIAESLDARPRVKESHKDSKTLMVLLEHAVIASDLTFYDELGPETLEGYLSSYWHLTALPQKNHRFRNSRKSVHLYRVIDVEGTEYFTERDARGKLVYTNTGELRNQDDEYQIQEVQLNESELERLWMVRNYRKLLQEQLDTPDGRLNNLGLKFGELVFQENGTQYTNTYSYNNNLGLYKSSGE